MHLGISERVTETHVYFVGGPLSQWFPCQFKSVNYLDLMAGRDGVEYWYTTTEQWMMHNKAILMGDIESADKIINEDDPKIIKELGKQVKNWNDKVWDRFKYSIVVEGNFLKFADPKFRKFIESTGDRTIVEAAWYDKIWGVGLRQSDNDILDEKKWKGLNLLGKALMVVRGDECGHFEMCYEQVRHDLVDLITNPRNLEKW